MNTYCRVLRASRVGVRTVGGVVFHRVGVRVGGSVHCHARDDGASVGVRVVVCAARQESRTNAMMRVRRAPPCTKHEARSTMHHAPCTMHVRACVLWTVQHNAARTWATGRAFGSCCGGCDGATAIANIAARSHPRVG